MHRRKSSAERFETETSAKNSVIKSLLPEFSHFCIKMHQTGGTFSAINIIKPEMWTYLSDLKKRLTGRLRNTTEKPKKMPSPWPSCHRVKSISYYPYIYIYEVVMSWSSLTVARDSWSGSNAFISANSGKGSKFLGSEYVPKPLGNPISTQLIQYENKSMKIRFILHTK